jgi:hypothetical protein
MGEDREMFKVLLGKPEGKRPLGRPRRRWEDEIRMDHREIGLGGCGLDSTVSGQGPVAGCCECGDEPSGSCATELVSFVTVYNKMCSLSTTSDFLVILDGMFVIINNKHSSFYQLIYWK